MNILQIGEGITDDQEDSGIDADGKLMPLDCKRESPTSSILSGVAKMVASVTDTVAKDLDLQLTKSPNQLVRLNCSVFKTKNKSAWKERAIRQRRSQRRS